VALDGDTVVAGAHGDDRGDVADAGAVYIFKRDGTLLSEEAKLMASDKEASAYFGISVALDRDTVVVPAQHSECARLRHTKNIKYLLPLKPTKFTFHFGTQRFYMSPYRKL
jgi:hypothetical protein